MRLAQALRRIVWLAAALAHGLELGAAARAAKRYVHGALAHADALQVGSGCGPVHHFHALWPTPPRTLVE